MIRPKKSRISIDLTNKRRQDFQGMKDDRNHKDSVVKLQRLKNGRLLCLNQMDFKTVKIIGQIDKFQ